MGTSKESLISLMLIMNSISKYLAICLIYWLMHTLKHFNIWPKLLILSLAKNRRIKRNLKRKNQFLVMMIVHLLLILQVSSMNLDSKEHIPLSLEIHLNWNLLINFLEYLWSYPKITSNLMFYSKVGSKEFAFFIHKKIKNQNGGWEF